MAEQTHEETEQTTSSGEEQTDRPSNGDAHPSGTLSTGVALTIGGAVVGALLALLRARRATDLNGTEANEDAALDDELVARASAAARGRESADESGEHEHDDQDEPSDEAVGVAQGAESEAAASGDGDGDTASGRADPEAHAGGATSAPEREATEPEDEGDAEPASPAATDEDVTGDKMRSRNEDGAEAAGSVDDEEEPDEQRVSQRRDDGGSAGEGGAFGAARSAARQLEQLTGKAPESVIGVERSDGGWRVSLQVVEVARTPPTTDVLGTYEVELDGDGELVEYQQVGRYVRGRAAEGG